MSQLPNVGLHEEPRYGIHTSRRSSLAQRRSSAGIGRKSRDGPEAEASFPSPPELSVAVSEAGGLGQITFGARVGPHARIAASRPRATDRTHHLLLIDRGYPGCPG